MLYAIDIETVDSKGEPCLNWRRGSILCVGICDEQYNVKVVKFDSIGKAVIQDILGDSKNSVLFWNAVYDLTWLAQFGVQCLAPVYDVMLLYRLMFNRDDLDCQLRSVAQSLVNMHIPQIEEGLENKVKYDVIATMKIWKELVSILHSKAETERARVWKYFTELIMPNIYVFVSMQLRGLGVDTDLLKEKIKELKAKVEGKLLKLGNKIGNINLNSPKQLSKYIYGQLGAKPISKGDSVSYSVDESVLVQLAKQYPICEEILEFRKDNKALSVLKGFSQHVIDGRVYPHYNMNSAVSGRICTTNPQVQNLAASLRNIIIPTQGYKFIVGDLSQIELRIAAHVSGDEKLCNAFREHIDLHQQTADLLGVDRKTGKTINFGILYGMGPNSLSEILDISKDQAQKYIEKFFQAYPKLKQCQERVYQNVREFKQASSLLGRYRYFNDVTDRDLRSAFDHVFQGTASDFLLVILRNIYRDLNFGYIVLQVFDSVMIEVPVSCVNQGVEFLKEKMTKFLKSDFAVPIEAEIKVLDRWE